MQIITTDEQLKSYCQTIQNYDFITVDTEFLREKTYFSKLCLIQVATPDFEENPNNKAIIDPLSSINLSPFFDILKNNSIVKVLHSAKGDIEIFCDLMGELPNNVFDTQIGVMALGYGEQIGYDNLVKKICKTTIDKGARFTDWSNRPLSQKQLDYAISDVTYLVHIYNSIKQELDNLNRHSWLESENKVLNDINTYKPQMDEVYKKIKFRTNKPKTLAMLKELAKWREQKSIKNNIPRRHFLRDETLIDIASNNIKSDKDLLKVRNFPKSWNGTDKAKHILGIINQVNNMNEKDYPQIEKPEHITDSQKAVEGLLKSLLKECADKNNVCPGLIAKGNDLESFVKSPQQSPLLKGWKKEVFGENALELINGKIALAVKDNKLQFIKI